MAARNDVYSIVTDKVIRLLEAGTVPWRKPWKGANHHPCNARTGSQYRGINPFLLQVEADCSGYGDHRWLTFKQAKDAGGNVRKGESSTLVIFWKWYETTDKTTDKEVRIPCLRYFRVFNVLQCDGLDEAKLKAEPDVYEPTRWESIESAQGLADGFLARSGLAERIDHGGNRACYRPVPDSLQMPDCDRFSEPSEYYSTLFHELTHATGHSSRLDRLDLTSFGSSSYAKEELVAEMGAAFLCGFAGIDMPETLENSAAYLAGWLRCLRSDSRMIASAAAQAQKAADLIIGRTYEDAATGAEQPRSVEV